MYGVANKPATFTIYTEDAAEGSYYLVKERTLYTEICSFVVHSFCTLLVLELMKLLSTFGIGGLDLAVEGPSKAEIGCIDNKDGTCTVTYLPTLPGDYNILVRYNDKHIAGSPFTARITGEDLGCVCSNVPLLFI